MVNSTAALVGATGGAGATRLAVELGATLARDGRDVAVLDAAFATEGLARHVSGRIDPDATKLLTDDGSLSAGLRDHAASADLPGRLALCPARAPFERVARAKTADAARRFEALLADAAAAFDRVLVDAPPVAANQSVAAVNAADRVAVVAPAGERGVDAVQRALGRVADVGASADAVLANRVAAEADGALSGRSEADRASDHPVRSADVAIPESDATGVGAVPASAPDPEAGFAPAVARAAEVVFDAELDLEFEESGVFDFDAEGFVPDALSK